MLAKSFSESTSVAVPTLAEKIEQAISQQQRLTLNYRDQLFIALVPVAQAKLIEELEECFDIQAVKEAHQRSETPIPLAEAEQFLG